ncbi:MAG: phenylalanine--tRNA ligase subunit beta [Bacteroidia bacterium]|nr:phenylalanine--tRNA ligase subunit beta [Bacteroidia bacterium]
MKISYNWLKTLINTTLSANEVAEQLTAAGLEVEGTEAFESISGGLKGLMVGHILECAKHPDADRLSLTKVDIGRGEPLSIVCGAPNVAVGQKVIVATVGTKLYPSEGDPFEIKKSKIRGAASEGMICAEDEIGLGKSHAGIMVLPEDTAVGLPASEYFNIESDVVLEIGLTPNRSDAASHLGVARDLAALLNTSENNHNNAVKLIGLNELPEASGLEQIAIKIENPEACKRYSGLVISGVTVSESPDWLKNRLKSIGLRPINNVVDITNFVLHELGQPLHAFDVEKIKGKQVLVRTAKAGEKFKTLDGVERTLNELDLMICNEQEAMCIAGVFGGLESGVTEKTTSVLLESAYFDAGFVRRTAKRHGLKTDASFRFERGTDPEITVTALVRAANLILEIAGGRISMDVTDIYPEKLEPYKVAFSYENCTDLIGKEIDRGIIKNIILNLGIEINSEGSDGLLLHVPRYKTDVTRQADVVEEVMRIYGYNHVEASKAISYSAGIQGKQVEPVLENKIGTLLEGFGFNEMMNLSLSKENYYASSENLVKVLNPLSSDLNVLRADLLYSGLETIVYNINRKNSDLKLFEFGRTYELGATDDDKYKEEKYLSIFVSGNLFSQNPYALNQKADFSYLKNVVNALLQKCGVTSFKTTESTYSEFSSGLTYLLNNKALAELGLVSKKALKQLDVPQDVAYARINWKALVKAWSKQKIEFEEISKFPSVRRDLALLIDKTVKYQQIEELAYATEKKFLKEVNLFDIYESEKLGNKKSYAVSFTLLNNEATLTDKQIDGVMEKLITNYKEKLGAELR